VELIGRRLDAISALIGDWALREQIRKVLRGAPDLSRALSRLKLKRGGPRDLGALRDGLLAAEKSAALLEGIAARPAELDDLLQVLSSLKGTKPRDDGVRTLTQRLQAALGETLPYFTRDGGFIAAGYDAGLDELRQLAAGTKAVLAKLQATYATQTGIKTLK